MSEQENSAEQARRVKHEAIPEWADGLYYNKGLFSEALAYHDDRAIHFEIRGKESGIVRFSFEMRELLEAVMNSLRNSLQIRETRDQR